MTGLDHIFKRTKDFGLTYPSTATPVLSMGIGTLELHPIDLLGAYGTIANGGVKMPRKFINTIFDANGARVWPASEEPVQGKRVTSAAASYVITDILSGNTDVKVNPFWGKWAIYDGKTRRPAAYKTGTTRTTATSLRTASVATAEGPEGAGAGRRCLDGQLRQQPQRREAVPRHVGAALVGDPPRGQQGPADRQVQPTQGHRARLDRRVHRPSPGPFTHEDDRRVVRPGTVPRARETLRMAATIDASSGLLWQDGCAGPKVTRGFFDLNDVDAGHPNWQRADAAWAARAASGPGVGGRRQGHADRRTSIRTPSLPSDERGARRSCRGRAVRSMSRHSRSSAIRSRPPAPTPCAGSRTADARPAAARNRRRSRRRSRSSW